MAVTTKVFTKLDHSLAAKLANLQTDALKVMLLSSFTPGTQQTTAQYLADILNQNNPWAATTALALNYLMQPTTPNGHYYKVTTAGTTAGAEPTWPTGSGATVVDGTVTWTEQGAPVAQEARGTGYTPGGQALASVNLSDASLVTTLTCANPSWNAAAGSLAAAYAIFYDSTPGTYATDPVLLFWDFGGTVTATSAAFTLTISGSGLLTFTAT